MKMKKNGNNTYFQIKIGDKYVTVAELEPWLLSMELKYSLKFYHYGVEFTDEWRKENGITYVWLDKHEDWNDFIKRVKNIVAKKLYIIASSILEEIRYVEE